MSKPSGGVPAHKHCPVCGISISPNKDYCSPECREADEKNQNRVKNFRRISLILLLVTMIALVAVTLLLHAKG